MGDDASAIILSRGTTFLIANARGDCSGGDEGLYAGDMRLVHRYEWRVGGQRPQDLSGRAIASDEAQFFYTGESRGGAADLVLERRIRLGEGGFAEQLRLCNYGARALAVSLELRVGADFAHVFRVKRRALGGRDPDLGRTQIPPQRLSDSRIAFAPPGGAGPRLVVDCAPAPADFDPAAGRLRFRLRLPPRGATLLRVVLSGGGRASSPPRRLQLPQPAEIAARGPLGTALEQAYARAMEDLRALGIRGGAIGLGEGDAAYAFSAGIPWYIALFGRDALITSHMTVYTIPELGEGSLRALAQLQGRRHDAETGEEPGKILHEFRPDDASDRSLIPRFPYYGSVDATPLFVIALEEQVRICDNVALLHDLAQALHAALGWLDGPGDPDGDGYLEYYRKGSSGLRNQGWKDSWDAIHDRDGALAEGPVALAEVQGYLYRARRAGARLLRCLGEEREARRQVQAAQRLRRRFHKDFWLPGRGTYALGLDGRKRPLDALTSNALQTLWGGVAAEGAAHDMAALGLREPLWSGFGVRTLAAGEGRYNPVSYHNGSVWPHDNALIAEGLRRYREDEAALRLIAGLLQASRARLDRRLPELFAGFSREESRDPVAYPSACPVQAWAAAAVPHAVTLMLGLEVERGVLRISPALPEGIDRLDAVGLRVLGREVEIRAVRDRRGAVQVHVRAPSDLRWHVRRPRRQAVRSGD